MNLLGAEVVSVTTGTMTLNDAVSEAIKYWVDNVNDTFYIIGSAVGPHPYPTIVKRFQRIIGDETKIQIMEAEGRMPDYIIAPVGGGSNAIGMFAPFIGDENIKLIGVEAAGLGLKTGKHAATITMKQKGVIHGMYSYVLQDKEGNIKDAYSISSGLDYPGVGPEHAFLDETNNAPYVSVTDMEALDAFLYLTKKEGIVPALESAHAVAYTKKLAHTLQKDKIIVVNMSGRGDKDMDTVLKYLE